MKLEGQGFAFELTSEGLRAHFDFGRGGPGNMGDHFIPYQTLSDVQFQRIGLGSLLTITTNSGKQLRQSVPIRFKEERLNEILVFTTQLNDHMVKSRGTNPLNIDELKICPDCAEGVKFAARKCRYCGHEFADC